MTTTVQPQVHPQVQDGNTELRRLKPAADVAARAGALGEQAVQQVLTRAPPSLKPSLEAAVEKAGPLVAKAADSGATLLKAADERVDAALDAATNAYAKNSAYLQEQLARQKEFHAQNLESYKQAREAYLQKVEHAVEYMKEKGLVGAARDAADEVLARVGEAKAAVMAAPAALVHKVQQAVDRLLAYGPVSSAVEAAKPHLATAKDQYMRVHDRVLATPQYRQAFDLANQLAARLEQTWLYTTARARLPASAVDTATPYFNSMVQHLKPIAAGGTSTSLWDATSVDDLQQWLDESINVDVTHQVVEVQEEFALGLGEVHRARAAEKVKEGTKEVAHKTGEALSSAATAVGHQVNELDHKLRISERATAASAAVKESAVGRATGAALTKVGSAVSSTTKSVLAHEKVQTATGAVGASFKKLGASLSSLGRRKADDAPGSEHVPQFVQESEGYEPTASSQQAHDPPAPVAGGNLRNPTAAPAAATASPEAQQQATFTLDDNDDPKAP